MGSGRRIKEGSSIHLHFISSGPSYNPGSQLPVISTLINPGRSSVSKPKDILLPDSPLFNICSKLLQSAAVRLAVWGHGTELDATLSVFWLCSTTLNSIVALETFATKVCMKGNFCISSFRGILPLSR